MGIIPLQIYSLEDEHIKDPTCPHTTNTVKQWCISSLNNLLKQLYGDTQNDQSISNR